VARLIADLKSGDRTAQIAAVKKAAQFRDLPEEIVAAAIELHEQTKNEEVRGAIEAAAREIGSRQVCYRPEEVARVRELSNLRVTNEQTYATDADATLRLTLAIAGNGANFVVIKPAAG
jgi:hypothetical protein